MTSRQYRAADHALFNCFLVLLFWAPLPFGSNRPWGLAILFLASALLLLWWLMLWMVGKIQPAKQLARELLWPLVLLGLVQFGVFIQTIPLPRAWVELLSPHAASLQLIEGRIPLSLDPELTRFHLLQGLAFTIGFALVGVLVNRRERLRRMLWMLVISGVFQSVFGVLMTLSGVEYGFFVEKYSGLGVPTGTFVNRNHLAGYLVMALACGTGLLISQLGNTPVPTTSRGWLREGVTLLLGSKFRLRLMLALMVVGLVLTRSRMGNLSFFLSLTLSGAVLLLCSGRQLTRKVALLLVSLVLVDMAIVGRWFGVEEVAERLVQSAETPDSRAEVSGYSLEIIRNYPWTGAGGGTFYTVFPNYSQPGQTGDYYVHAHNDYVEMAGDLGLPLFVLLGLFVVATTVQSYRLLRSRDSRLDQGCGFAVLMVITWAAIHSTVDFNLYIPANAFTLVSIMALAWVKKGDD